jgi:hypothetical protein
MSISWRSLVVMGVIGALPTSASLGFFRMVVHSPLLGALLRTLLFLNSGPTSQRSSLSATAECGNADTRRQSLRFAFFFSPFNIDTDVIRVAAFLLKLAMLFPETAFVEASPSARYSVRGTISAPARPCGASPQLSTG